MNYYNLIFHHGDKRHNQLTVFTWLHRVNKTDEETVIIQGEMKMDKETAGTRADALRPHQERLFIFRIQEMFYPVVLINGDPKKMEVQVNGIKVSFVGEFFKVK